MEYAKQRFHRWAHGCSVTTTLPTNPFDMQCAAAAGWWPLHDPHARTSAVLTSIDEFGWHSPLLTPGTHAAASPVTKAPGLEHETPAPGPMGRPRASGRNPTHGRSPKVVPILWLPECLWASTSSLLALDGATRSAGSSSP